LYYIRWIGTAPELKEYVDRINEITSEVDGVDFRGIFSPTSEWNFVLLFEGTSYNNVLEVYKQYMVKFNPHPKIPVGKVEVLHTFEEFGYSI
jgi:hypothetical protein